MSTPDQNNRRSSPVQPGKQEPGTREPLAAAVQRVLAGDLEAYAIIYRACDRPLRSFIRARRRGRSADFVGEVAVRTHEYALKRLAEYRSDAGASFQTWLNWHSHNVARKVRAERFDPNTVSLDERTDVQYVLTAFGPAEEYQKRRRDQVLRQELRSLDERGRLSIAAHDLAGLTYPASARRLGLTVAQVRHARKLALLEMKERLQRRNVTATEVLPWYGRAFRPRNGTEAGRG